MLEDIKYFKNKKIKFEMEKDSWKILIDNNSIIYESNFSKNEFKSKFNKNNSNIEEIKKEIYKIIDEKNIDVKENKLIF